MENNNGVFTIPAALNGEVLNCTITSNSGTTNGLTLTTIDFLVDNNPSGIEEQVIAKAKLYPNPTSDIVYIDLSQINQMLNVSQAATLNISIYNASGKFIANGYNGSFADASTGAIAILVKQYAISAGAYYIQVTVGDMQFMLGLNIE